MKKNSNKKITLESLAHMVARGFESVGSDTKDIRTDIKDIRTDIKDVKETFNNRINGLERRIDDLALNRSTRDEMRIIDIRLSRVEKQIGLKK